MQTKEFHIGNKLFTFCWVTGKLLELDKNSNINHHSSFGPHGGTSSVTSTVVDNIILDFGNGLENSYQLEGFNVSSRKGNTLSIIWILKNKNQSGPYLAVLNHDHNKRFFLPNRLKTISRPNSKWYLIIGFLSTALFSLITFYIISNGFGSYKLSENFLSTFIFTIAFAGIISLILFAFYSSRKSSIQYKLTKEFNKTVFN